MIKCTRACRVVDPEHLEREVPDGATGVLMAKGPGVMSGGYWRNQEANDAAFLDGFFNTGPLPSHCPASHVALQPGCCFLVGFCSRAIALDTSADI